MGAAWRGERLECRLLPVAFGWAFSSVSCLGRLGLYFVGICSWFGFRCRDCPRLGQSLFAAPKSNQKSLLNTHGGTPCAPLALRSDSRRESEFLRGSALRFARACLLRFGCVFVLLPAACFELWMALVAFGITSYGPLASLELFIGNVRYAAVVEAVCCEYLEPIPSRYLAYGCEDCLWPIRDRRRLTHCCLLTCLRAYAPITQNESIQP